MNYEQCRNCYKLVDDNKLIQYFIDVIEAKDKYTQGHSHHVKVITEAIYDCLPKNYQNKLDKSKIINAALLHDIGKIETPDMILNKASSLTDDEWKVMQEHPKTSKEILKNTVFREMGDWVLYHHERIDGRGYYGLKEEKIPLESKIIAIADTFSALRTYRIYRPAKTMEETLKIMRESAGTQLDKELLEYFFSLDIKTLDKLECNCEICRQRREALQDNGTYLGAR
ncbi:MAG: HD domain-containing protein [Spirochaetaceae bacterium]|nr:HD domain-containing protein [Spirochaetaceae bacterium]